MIPVSVAMQWPYLLHTPLLSSTKADWILQSDPPTISWQSVCQERSDQASTLLILTLFPYSKLPSMQDPTAVQRPFMVNLEPEKKEQSVVTPELGRRTSQGSFQSGGMAFSASLKRSTIFRFRFLNVIPFFFSIFLIVLVCLAGLGSGCLSDWDCRILIKEGTTACLSTVLFDGALQAETRCRKTRSNPKTVGTFNYF